jgi:P-type Cu2+ transporter
VVVFVDDAAEATLTATGILVSYVYSAGATIAGGTDDVFFEAAAMLTTFSLAGHWRVCKAFGVTGFVSSASR